MTTGWFPNSDSPEAGSPGLELGIRAISRFQCVSPFQEDFPGHIEETFLLALVPAELGLGPEQPLKGQPQVRPAGLGGVGPRCAASRVARTQSGPELDQGSVEASFPEHSVKPTRHRARCRAPPGAPCAGL